MHQGNLPGNYRPIEPFHELAAPIAHPRPCNKLFGRFSLDANLITRPGERKRETAPIDSTTLVAEPSAIRDSFLDVSRSQIGNLGALNLSPLAMQFRVDFREIISSRYIGDAMPGTSQPLPEVARNEAVVKA